MPEILSYFPFPDFRKYQSHILALIQDYIESYNYIFLEAPTGFGKSAVGYTLAVYLLREFGHLSHICVGDKYLQQQYLVSFPDIVSIMGRNNFKCPLDHRMIFDEDEFKGEITCDKAICTILPNYSCDNKPKVVMVDAPIPYPLRDKHGIVFDWTETQLPYCPYWQQKDRAIRSPITIHNYYYFLYEQNFAHSFTKRHLGVLDEAHIIESVLMNFVQEGIYRSTLERIYRHFDEAYSPVIPLEEDIDSWLEWMTRVVKSLIDITEKFGPVHLLDYQRNSQELRMRALVDNIKDRINNLIDNINRDRENWVWIRKDRSIIFKPITITDFSQYLFSHINKKLLMSATILDKERLKEYLGINEEVKFLRVNKSTFPVESRPLYHYFVGKATHKTMSDYLPKMLKVIDEHFIPLKKENKGVIHTHTHKIAQYILGNSIHRDIMVTNTGREDLTREEIFEEFFETEPPCVMISPSMNLGVDLFDDRCRWQLICKTPYPDLSDPQISKRTRLDQSWYSWQTLMTLIQTYGRGVRSEDDWCETFVLDSKYGDLASRNYRLLPGWFREATRVVII